jgi:hypothetical protein
MRDGSTRRLTMWGFGDTYQQRIADAKEQATRHGELKGARVITIR